MRETFIRRLYKCRFIKSTHIVILTEQVTVRYNRPISHNTSKQEVEFEIPISARLTRL